MSSMEGAETLKTLLNEHVQEGRREEIKYKVLTKLGEWKRAKGYTQKIRKDVIEDVIEGAFILTCKEEGIYIEGEGSNQAYKRVSLVLGGVPPARPSELVPHFVDTLGLTEEEQKRATKLATFLEGRRYHIGKSPRGLAGACLYLATEGIPQKIITEAVGTTTVTIRKHKKFIREVAPDGLLMETGEKGGRRLTDDEREKVRGLLEERGEGGDLTYEEIAKRVGCSISAVGYYAKRWELR